MKIMTSFVYPPIPDRNHDWFAYDDDTYDGSLCEEDRCWQLTGPGRTEVEAIADLKENYESHFNKPFPEAGRTASEYGNDELRWPDGLQHY